MQRHPHVVVVVGQRGGAQDGVGSLNERSQPFLHPPHLRQHLHKLCWARVAGDKGGKKTST